MGRKKLISDVELLDVARAVFVESGFGASTKEIARRAGVSEGVIFQRFPTKDDLFFAAMIPPAADLHKLLHHPRSKGRALLEKLTFAMIEYWRETFPVLLPLVAHPSFRFEEFTRRHPDTPLSQLRGGLVQFFVEEQRAGGIGPVNPGAAALLVWSIAQTVVFFERMGAHDGRMDPKIVRETVGAMWEGLAPRKT
ncbi:MAG TPA: TetR/AcrR family transcriptional regulator [Bryobacteraceae bacterium]|nr:TetR/AcrR family transcriptional regulator [Bryobacteraceae bacterium]